MPRKFNKQKKLHVKKGDMVQVIAGNDKGKTGKVLRVLPANDRVLVEGVNLRIKHEKPSQDLPQGGRISVRFRYIFQTFSHSIHQQTSLPVLVVNVLTKMESLAGYVMQKLAVKF